MHLSLLCASTKVTQMLLGLDLLLMCMQVDTNHGTCGGQYVLSPTWIFFSFVRTPNRFQAINIQNVKRISIHFS